MIKNFRKFFLFTMVLVFSIVAQSAMSIKADRTVFPLDEAVRVRAEFIDEDKKDYIIEGIENFQIMGKSSSRSISIINLKKSSQESDDYLLRAKAVGKYNLKIKNSKGESQNLELTVTNPGAANQLSTETEKSEVDNLGKNNFLITSNIGDRGDKKYYFGEKIFYEEKFIGFRNFRDFSIISRPDFKDFSEKNLTPVGRNGSFVQNIVEYMGRQALEINLYRGILQANSSGVKSIKGFEVEVLDNGYIYLGGKNTELEILPLPPEKPSNFKGIVGQLEIEYKLNGEKGRVGQPLLMDLKLYGDVNLDNINEIAIPENQDFTIYESLKSQNERIQGERYYAEKIFEIAFIPKKAGELITPEFNISYLDTVRGKYEWKKVPSMRVDISQGEIGGITTENNKMESTPSGEFFNQEIEEKEPKFYEKREVVLSSLILNILFLVMFIVFGILFIKKKNFFQERRNSWKDWKRKLEKISDDKEFYDNYSQYMKERYGFNPKTQSERKLDDENLRECNRIIEEWRYSKKNIDKKSLLKKLFEN